MWLCHLLVQVVSATLQLLQVLLLHLGSLLGIGQRSVGTINLSSQCSFLGPAMQGKHKHPTCTINHAVPNAPASRHSRYSRGGLATCRCMLCTIVGSWLQRVVLTCNHKIE